ncbi:hypothetical protein BJX99DRAFT_65179 [Aspergillus californicus]
MLELQAQFHNLNNTEAQGTRPSDLSGKTSRGSSFSSFETQKSSKANSFDSSTSISTIQSSLTRKRSIDDDEAQSQNEVHNKVVQIKTPDVPSAEPPRESFLKYRRLSLEGLSTPTGRSAIPTPVSNRHNVQNNTPGAGDMPGCWPMTPGSTPRKLASEPHDEKRNEAMMSGALLSAPPVNSSESSSPHVTDAAEADPSNITIDERASILPTSLHRPIQRVCMLRRGIAQTVASAYHGVVALAGTVTQRALALLANRHRARGSSPTRRYSPVRATIRHMPEEQRRRIRAIEWRKDRGLPVAEEFPFPTISFDTPFSSTMGSISVSEGIRPSVEAGEPAAASRASRGGSPSLRGSETKTSKQKKSFLGVQKDSGVRKAPKIDTISPQIKHRLTRPRVRDRERGNLERALATGLRTGNFEEILALHAARTARTSISNNSKNPVPKKIMSNDSVSNTSTFVPTAPVNETPVPAKPKLKVRFQSPLETGPATHCDAPSPELAVYVRSALKKTCHPIGIVEQIPDDISEVDSDDEIEPFDIEPYEDAPSVDPWNEPPEFPLGRPVSAVSLFYPTKRPLPPGRTESIYAPAWRKIEEEQNAARIRDEGVAVRPLSAEWETRVKDMMGLPDHKKVATTLSGDPLTKRDLASCFTLGAWLNDEVINAYLAHIVDYKRRSSGNAGRNDKPRFHAFNSFFFSNLRDKGYESVRRWAGRAKIGGDALLNLETVFIPVHNRAHWTLIVVKPSARTIEHFDSLGSLSHSHVEAVKNWLRGELGRLYVDKEWKILPSNSPQQNNGSDCGIFLLTTAKAVAVGVSPCAYGAKNTPLLRKKIVAELMNGGLEGDFDPATPEGGGAL